MAGLGHTSPGAAATVAALCRAQPRRGQIRSPEAWPLLRPWVERLSPLHLWKSSATRLKAPCEDEGAAAPEEGGGGRTHPGLLLGRAGPPRRATCLRRPLQQAPAHLRQPLVRGLLAEPLGCPTWNSPPPSAPKLLPPTSSSQLPGRCHGAPRPPVSEAGASVPWGVLQTWPLLSPPPRGPPAGPPLLCRHPHTSHMAQPPSAPSLPSPFKPRLGPLTPLL